MRWTFGGGNAGGDRPLPAGWEERRDPSTGKPYYVDHTRKITTWDDPRLASDEPPAYPGTAARTRPPADALERDVAELQAIMPNVRADEIRSELLRTNGNKDVAINALLSRQPASAPRPPLAVAVATPVGSAPAKPAAGPVAIATPAGSAPAKPVAGRPPVAVATALPAGTPLSLAPHAVSWVHVPVIGNEVKPTGRRKALLIGINYFGTAAELKGCINDVRAMRELLVSHGFSPAPEHMCVLTDDQRDPRAQPTKANILSACRWLAADARPGDVLFFHFSGHGAQQADPLYAEEDGMDETIVPVDMQRNGQITDNELHAILVEPLPSGCRLTAVMDCCHSGTGLDLPFTLHGDRWRVDDNPHYTLGDVVFFSGCEDDDYSADARPRYGKPGGAMTTAFVTVVREGRFSSYPHFMQQMAMAMRRGGFTQRPQLCATQAFDTSRPFGFDHIHPNQNQFIGRQFRVKHKAKRRPFGGGLGDMLMVGAAGYLALSLAPEVMGAAAGGASLLLDGAGGLLGETGGAIEDVTRGLGNLFGGFFGD